MCSQNQKKILLTLTRLKSEVGDSKCEFSSIPISEIDRDLRRIVLESYSRTLDHIENAIKHTYDEDYSLMKEKIKTISVILTKSLIVGENQISIVDGRIRTLLNLTNQNI